VWAEVNFLAPEFDGAREPPHCRASLEYLDRHAGLGKLVSCC
jgi:hypothetical protein